MTCLYPTASSQDEDGLVHYKQPDAGPYYLETRCNHCEKCYDARARDWAIRVYHESLMHTRPAPNGGQISNNCMITLTYDEEHHAQLNDGSLDKRHWQLFLKKLRHRVRHRLAFLHCGEYGGTTGRAHYHACILGWDFNHDRELLSQTDNKTLWTSPSLRKLWGQGHVSVSPLTYETAKYVASYVVKKHTNRRFNPADYHWVNGQIKLKRTREYNTMSRRTGLGYTWLEKYYRDVYPRDLVTINGKDFRPPRYYDTKLKLLNPGLYDQVMTERRMHLEEKGPTTHREKIALRAQHKAQSKLRKERHT